MPRLRVGGKRAPLAIVAGQLADLLQVWLAPLREFSAEQDPQRVIGDYIRGKLAVSRDSPDASRLFCLEIIQGAPLLRDELGRELCVTVANVQAVVLRGVGPR